MFNDRGRFRVAAQIGDDVTAGVLVAPLGYWASTTPCGRTVDAVNAPRVADLGRAPTLPDTMVDVRHTG